MRKIKFRGQKLKSGEWVEGGIYEENGSVYIRRKTEFPNNVYFSYEVNPETVGQFTGLLAKSYKKNILPEIYEGDLFRQTKETSNGDITAYLVVMWIEQLAAFYLVPVDHYDVIKGNDVSKEQEFSWLFEDAELRDFSIDVGLMKVGNSHDNPELLQ
mgnify:CR=1 FL=1